MGNSKWTRIGVAAAVTALAVAVGAGSSSASSKKFAKTPYRVLAIMPFSGARAVIGQVEKTALESAQFRINNNGGILGHRVEITYVDDQGSGTVAVSVAEQALASGPTYNLIIPGASAPEAEPLAALLAKNPALQLPVANETQLNNPKVYPHLYVPNTNFYSAASGIVMQLKKNHITKFAIVEGADPTGQQGATSLQAAAQRLGLTVTSTVYVPDTTVDATSQLQQAQSSQPQAIAISGFTPANPAILAARNKLGWKVPAYLDISASAVNLGSFTTAQQRQGLKLEELPYFIQGSSAASTKSFKFFLNNIYRYDPKPPISMYGPLITWDVLMLARAAAVHANSIVGAAESKALGKISKSSQVPGYIGGTQLYSHGAHIWNWSGSTYVFSRAGVLVNGMLVQDPA